MKLLCFYFLTIFLNVQNAQETDRDSRIIGGVDADIREFPFIVALIYKEYQQCGGSLISEYWVVTAAHCEIPIDNDFKIEYGTAELKLFGSYGKFATPVAFIAHENFSRNNLKDDIALVKLKDPIVTGYQSPFAKFAVPGFQYSTGQPAVIAGWGIWSYENYTQPPLQKLNAQIWNFKDCQKVFEDVTPLNGTLIFQTNICAGLPDYSKAHCSGDSGGPLLVDGIQVGIVSWSLKPCTVAKYPGVYTAVASYIDWISGKTGINFGMKMFLMNTP